MSKSSKGAQQFSYEFWLCEVICLNCIATIRFGKVESVRAYHTNSEGVISEIDPDGVIVDWADEYIPLKESLKLYAGKFYKQAQEEDEIQFIPEIPDEE